MPDLPSDRVPADLMSFSKKKGKENIEKAKGLQFLDLPSLDDEDEAMDESLQQAIAQNQQGSQVEGEENQKGSAKCNKKDTNLVVIQSPRNQHEENSNI